MKNYIDIINNMYEQEAKSLTESLRDASDFEIDLILESLDEAELSDLRDRLMEFDQPSDQDMSLLTKIGAKIFGQQWAQERQSAAQSMQDYDQFMSNWTKYSKRFNLKLTPENLKDFAKNEYGMKDSTYQMALAKAKPKVDPRTKEISNMQQMVPALAYAYFYGMEDAVEKRAEEKQIDIDALGFNDLPNNDTKYQAPAAKAVAGDDKAGQPAGQPANQQNNQGGDAGNLSASQISTKMGKVLSGLHVSSEARQQAMTDAARGFNQSFSKNSRTLAAIGYAYLKAISAV